MNKDQTEAIITAIIFAGFMSRDMYDDSERGKVLEAASIIAAYICGKYTDL